jgi:bacillolysin
MEGMMRTRLLMIVAVTTLAVLCVGQAVDAQSRTSPRGGSRRSQISSQFHKARVAFQPHTRAVRMLGGSVARPVATRVELGLPPNAVAAASAFLDRNARIFGVGSASDLRPIQRQAASGGRTILRYQQTYRDVPVLAGDLVVDVSRGNDIISVNGEAAAGLSLGVDPAVSAPQALRTAIAAVARDNGVASTFLTGSTPALWIHDARLFGPDGALGSKLAWRTEVTSEASGGVRELVMVDAQRGGVLFHFSEIETVAASRFVCDRHNVSRAEKTCGTKREPVVITADKSGYNAASVDAQRAFDYSGNTWNFYFKRFGRDSLDGNGLQLKSTVRFCDPHDSCPYQNAYWNGTQMFYGAGYARGDDVDGHELTHGLTEFTSNLLYFYESGAINEAMSDIMGEFIDQDYNDSHDLDTAASKWQVGEDLPGGALRDMEHPELGHPRQPDTMISQRWFKAPNYYCFSCDNGGVHYNSGVANKAAFLLGEDASHPPIAFDGQSIKPLGRDKAAALFFEVDAHILTSGSRYLDLASAMKQACQNLLGSTPRTKDGTPSPTGAFTSGNCAQVSKVIAATHMTHRAPNGPPAGAAACPAARPHRSTVYAEDVEYTQAEAASIPWVRTGGLWNLNADYASSASRSKTFHDFKGTDFGTSAISSTNIRSGFLTMKNAHHIPANAYLRFDQSYLFDNGQEDSTPNHNAYDGGRVEYSTDGGHTWKDLGPLFDSNGYNSTIVSGRGNPLAGKRAFGGQSNGYYASRANLSSLVGDDVTFRWHIASDRQYGDLGWFLDDIAIYSCS